MYKDKVHNFGGATDAAVAYVTIFIDVLTFDSSRDVAGIYGAESE